MDPKRPPTSEASTIPESPAPGIPAQREVLMWNEKLPGTADLEHALELGQLIVAREQYGIVCGWKESEGRFRGVLLQQRSVMEDKTFDTADDLRAWYMSTVLAVEG